jgi:YjbR
MTPIQFRKIALSLPGTAESEHMGHPDFRVGGKIFASLGAPNEAWGMVKLTPDQQTSFVEANAESFQPCSGAWGRQGCTNIKLAAANTPIVRSALTLAVENVAASLPAKQRIAKPTGIKKSKKPEK